MGGVDGGGPSSKARPDASLPEMSITSDEVNFLVYRYLQESGTRHRPLPPPRSQGWLNPREGGKIGRAAPWGGGMAA
jgi:hypothetical protein